MEFLKLSEISSKIMTLIDEAELRFVAVSPYVRISQWEKMKKKLKSLAERNVTLEVCVRQGETESVDEIKRIGIVPHQIKNLHCKLYFNETTAIVTSLNLLYSSEVNSIEMGYQTTTKGEYAEVLEFYERYLSKPGEVIPRSQETALNTGSPYDRLQACLLEGGVSAIVKMERPEKLLVLVGDQRYYVFVSGSPNKRIRIQSNMNDKYYTLLKRSAVDISRRNPTLHIEFCDRGPGKAPSFKAVESTVVLQQSIERVLEFEFDRIYMVIVAIISTIEKMKIATKTPS